MWVCADCGLRHGTRLPVMATWHEDTCGVCGAVGPVTEARDFGGEIHCGCEIHIDCEFSRRVKKCLEDILDAADAREALAEAHAHGTISLADLLAKHAAGPSSNARDLEGGLSVTHL